MTDNQSGAPLSFEQLLAMHSTPAETPQPAQTPESVEPEVVSEITGAKTFAELAETFGIRLEEPAQVVESEPQVVESEPETELSFELSPNLIKEPQTNSIVLDIADPLISGEIITESGEVVRTGSIELPILTNTGSIPVITLPEDRSADDQVKQDFADNYVTSIAPVRASGVMNSRARESVLPLKTRRGEGQTVLLAVTSILMVTVGALVLAAWMLGIFNRPLGTN
jgi:hypothetical protein